MDAMLSLDRQRGTLLGLAVGDALGAAIEFAVPGSFLTVTGYRVGGLHGLARKNMIENALLGRPGAAR
jgi:ADP-ribosylglycohydrolase